jgi:beta-phosphoglucomutase-like phosphatase (HAD superfamily)
MRALGLEHGFAISADELQRLAAAELDLVVELLEAKVESSPGAADMLTEVCQWGVTRAVVSSSELRRIRTCLRRAGLDQFIPQANVFSATDSLAKPKGKPSPAIYEHAAQALDIAPEQCLAVEDSRPGVVAAVQAKIEVVGYVGAKESPDKRSELSRMLFEAGAVATFGDWPSFLAWVRPHVSVLDH